jgi:hypothetical protein
MQYEVVHTEERDGFTVTLSVTPETDAPDWDFETPEDEAETLRKINSGLLLWFVAKATASKHDIELATDYLGGCCYAAVEDFLSPGDYWDDMRATVIAEARSNIAKLCA